ncbi:MAG: RNA polymerase sporulation sigma factor SigH [Acidimicrobiales bacterium]
MACRTTICVLVDSTDEELAARFQGGDEDALHLLLQRYRRFARGKASSYFLVGADGDDIEQESLIGLYKAARDYRPDRQASFRAFAELCVTRQIISAIKSATRHKHQALNQYISLSVVRGSDRGGGADGPRERGAEDFLADPRLLDPADEVVSREQIRGMRQSVADALSGLEVEVLRLYVDGKSYQEIGEQLGRHVKSIDNALQRIKRKLDHHLHDAEDTSVLAQAS